MKEARIEARANIAARGNASKIRFLEFSSVEFRRDEVTALASADAESFIYPSAKMPSARVSRSGISYDEATQNAFTSTIFIAWGGRGRKFKSCHSDQSVRSDTLLTL